VAALPQLGRGSAVERQAPAPEAAATHSLYERYAPQIHAFCLSKLGNREEAEDAVQSTFMNAFRGLQRGIVPEAEGAWLFKIAHNVCLSRRRAAWRRGRVEFANDLRALEEITPARGGLSVDDLIRLNEVLVRMPESQRKAILLREWQGLSYQEIGQELALSQSAVETLIFRARRSLALGLEGADEPGRKRRLRRLLRVRRTGPSPSRR
jgi:RNA polymerase sigma-70 factor, ECF subfamily